MSHTEQKRISNRRSIEMWTGVGNSPWALDPEDALTRGGCYALDNFGHFADPVAAGNARRYRRRVDSFVACGCGDSVDLQPAERA